MLILLIIVTSLLVSALSLLVTKKTIVLESLAVVAGIVNLVASGLITAQVISQKIYSSNYYFAIDSFGAILIMTLSVIGLATAVYSIGYLRKEVQKEIIGFRRVREYYVLMQLFILAMVVAISTTSPIIMWIAIEATTLSTVLLISFYNKPSAMEAAWKYLVINSVGLLLGFFGTLLILTVKPTGLHGLIDWNALLANATNFDPFVAKISFIFILIGYGTKMGLVPMHTWRPDAYSKATTPIVALLSGSLLDVAFLAILRFKQIVDLAIGNEFSRNLLIIFGLLSIVVSAFIILVQKNYKRLLAYSSIEHAGIMALGFGFGGLGSFAAVLHMIYHSFAKAALFFSAGNIFLKYSSTKIANVRGMINALPVTSVLFMVGFVSITGIPPFGLFFTEISILLAGISTHVGLVALAAGSLALVFVGFLIHAVSMVFGHAPEGISRGEFSLLTLISPMVLIAILIVISVYIPSWLTQLINSAILNY